MTAFPNIELQPVQMPTDASPVDRLMVSMLAELDFRAPLIDLFEDYYEGRHGLSFVTGPYRRAFGQMLSAVSDNWIPLIITASTERMHVQGIRTAEGGTSADDAWAIWRRSGLEEDADLAFTEASKCGESYILAERDPFDPRQARITTEHPRQFIVRREPSDRRRLRAALKVWWDEEADEQHLTMWTPDAIYRRRRSRNQPWFDGRTDAANDTNQLGRVPVGVIVNQPSMLPARPPLALMVPPHNAPDAWIGLGRSDEADAIPTVDQINLLLCNMLVASELSAFRQRWATGLAVPRDPTTGNPIEPFKAAVERLWISENPDTKFGEFTPTDLTNYIKAIESRIQSLASRSRTPAHYLMAGMVTFPSGESLRAAETGLVAKVGGKQRSAEPGILTGLSCACEIEGVALPDTAQVDWMPSESRAEAEFADSLIKKLSLGVPPQQLWTEAGYSPEMQQEFVVMLADAKASGLLDYVKPEPGQPTLATTAPASEEPAPEEP